MIAAWEALDMTQATCKLGMTLEVCLVQIEYPEDALGKNLVGIVYHDEPEGSELLSQVQRRIRSRVQYKGMVRVAATS